ncbi:PEP-CTERM sorting domain-containing protein, partial [Aeoliella sp.]|uniref:PEP-CTERM sorting domain-containing protein n=1 Tax=Aeoliella sp. TaxID=2795800 RepID=UPI003CCBFA7C
TTTGMMVDGDPGVGNDPALVQYMFDANGVDDVKLTYATTSGIFFLANGFELTSGGNSLNVDFQGTGGATEAGFMAYDSINGVDGSPDGVTRTETYASALGNSGMVDLTVEIDPFLPGGPAVDGNARAIDRTGNTYNGELADLAIDWIGADARTGGLNESIMVSLGNLKAGIYEVTSYHHDPQDLMGDLNVLVNGSMTTMVAMGNGDPGASSPPGSVSFLIASDGNSPVDIEYALAEFSLGPPLRAFPLINGIEVKLIPEPSTIWLCGLGAIGLIALRVRR